MSAAVLTAADAKRLAGLRARAALAGVVLLDSQNEHGQAEWIATKWHLTRAFSDLDELAGWLDRIGAPKC